MFRKYKDEAIIALASFLDDTRYFFKLSFAMRYDPVNDAIRLNSLALYVPVNIIRNLAPVDKLEAEEPRHLSFVIVARRIHIVVEVGGIKHALCRDSTSLSFH